MSTTVVINIIVIFGFNKTAILYCENSNEKIPKHAIGNDCRRDGRGHVSRGGICDRVRKKAMCKPISYLHESSVW
jgi:hypothetical protein